jgi:hypothetical protein
MACSPQRGAGALRYGGVVLGVNYAARQHTPASGVRQQRLLGAEWSCSSSGWAAPLRCYCYITVTTEKTLQGSTNRPIEHAGCMRTELQMQPAHRLDDCNDCAAPAVEMVISDRTRLPGSGGGGW